MILNEGFVDENTDIHNRLLRLNLLQPLRQEHIFAIFDFYCNLDTRLNTAKRSPVTTGLKFPASNYQRGREVPGALQRRLFGLR